MVVRSKYNVQTYKKETNLSKALFSYKKVLNCYCQRFSCDVKQFKYVNHLLDLRLAHCD